MSERTLLDHIAAITSDMPAAFPRVRVGPGHDCAAVDLSRATLVKVDQVVEGRHFRVGTPLDLVARKALARAVSDVAACAGRPVASMVSAVLPHGFARGVELFDAVHAWSRRFGCPVVGGDIATLAAGQPGPLVLSVSVLGDAHPVRGPVLRSGAQSGDGIYVTGRLGGSLDAATGLGHHLTFEPRVIEGSWLADHLGTALHAMMDVSDGLGIDAGRLARMSGVRLIIDKDRVPCTPGTEGIEAALGDGEDHELLFCAAAGGEVPAACPATGTPITRIGTVEPAAGGMPPGASLRDGAVLVDVGQRGWEHR